MIRKFIWFLSPLTFLILAACTPSIAPIEVTRVEKTATNIAPLANKDCKQSVIMPEDARCYLDNAGPDQLQRIDEETVVLLADPQSIANWAGAAIIYHIPTHSMIVLDRFGDGDPQASVFSERAGLAALSELAGDAELMAGLKQQVQSKWQTTPSNIPEIRLSTAWQDGSTSVFFIAVAGQEAADERFYCPSQTWTVGDSTVEIVPDCMVHEAGTPVSHFIFEAKTIKGSNERPVQAALNGVPSNSLQVREGPVAQETLIYQAVLKQINSRHHIVRGETASGFDEDKSQLVEAVDPALLQTYLADNKTPNSLRFLFQDHSTYSVQPSAAIERYYLAGSNLQEACAHFRSDYPVLGGVVTLSRIGMSGDGTQALVHMVHECGSVDRQAAYYTLAETDDGWQVTNTFAAATELPTLMP